ncbi:hypothetical protein MANES_15G011550v8 [Manihot esculenta]|uniref:Uncharacterized protein n=1 Tax=Manihot esculenta TaxID=3983 RepID=A0ACB7G8J9_MANES|nr:hypothetical protein MANES_15G011550v8 [Manihot esculenta]
MSIGYAGIRFSNSLEFLPSTLQWRRRAPSCAKDPNVCLDPEKNPHAVTKDTLKDPNNCGACGQTCAYGLVCCNGREESNKVYNINSSLEENQKKVAIAFIWGMSQVLSGSS